METCLEKLFQDTDFKMGFKQIKDSDRITFFNIFAREMLFTFSEEERTKSRIESEKIKNKFIRPSISSDTAFKRFVRIQNMEKPGEITNETEFLEPSKYQIKTDEEIMIEERKPIAHRQDINNNPENLRQLIRKKIIQPKQMQTMPQRIYPAQVSQTSQKTQQGISGYRKIEVLLNDMTVQSIECSGPERNIIVRKYNQTNITRIALTQQDITDIINEFSKQARIPIVGGILKAAVGNMIISAVISEFVGSRFIITKTTPYSLIKKSLSFTTH